MAKFRWDRAALAARETERLNGMADYPQVETPGFETTQAYLRRKRAAKHASQRQASANLAAMTRPLKPPSKRAQG